MKFCKKCSEEKIEDMFFKHSKSADGLQAYCKDCQKKDHAAYVEKNREISNAKRREYNALNKEKVKDTNKRSYEKNKDKYLESLRLKNLSDEDFRNRKAEYLRAYYAKNKERLLEQKREYYDNNKEIFRERYRKWRESESGKSFNRWYGHKKREAKRALDWQYSRADLAFTMETFEYKCYNCDSTDNLAIDHHMPMSLGHGLTRKNAVVLCQSCNSRKSDKLPENFYTRNKLAMLNALLALL